MKQPVLIEVIIIKRNHTIVTVFKKVYKIVEFCHFSEFLYHTYILKIFKVCEYLNKRFYQLHNKFGHIK